MNKKEWIIVIGLISLKLLFHFITSGNYELHRDALLYISLGEHPAWGYASVPPAIGVFANISRFLFGDTLFAFRFFPALLGGLSILLIALIIKDLGAKTFAIFLGGIAYLFSVDYLRTNALFQPVGFNQFFWLLSFYILVRLVKTKDLRLWLILGLVWGIAVLNKYSIGFFGISVLLAMAISGERKLLLNWYFPAGMVISFLILLPNLIWQYNHNWPVISHMAELQETQLINVSTAGFLIAQLIMNAHALILWISGLIIVFLIPELKKYRFIAITYFICLGILILLRGKAYYSLGLYPVLFALGAFAFERWFRERLYFLRFVAVFLIILTALPFIPLSAPLLKFDRLESYSKLSAKWIGPFLITWEDGEVHNIPQDFADMTGWKQLAEITEEAFFSLSPDEQESCMIYAPNYGRASAIFYYSHRKGLPEPVSFNDSYVLWAPDEIDAKHLIYVDNDLTNFEGNFESIELFGEVNDKNFRENGLRIYICRNAKQEFRDLYKRVAKERKEMYQK